MLAKKLLIVGLAIGILGTAVAVFAQSDDDQPRTDENKPKTFGQKLDKFGKSIFGGLLPAEKPKPKPMPKPSAMATPQLDDRPIPRRVVRPDASDDEPITSRSGNVVTRKSLKSLSDDEPGMSRPGSSMTRQARPSAISGNANIDPSELTPENTPPAVRRQTQGRPSVLSGDPNVDPTELTPENTPPAVRRQVRDTYQPATSKAAADSSAAPALHERLSGFRDSVFGSDVQDDATPQTNTKPVIVDPDAKRKPQPFAQPLIVDPDGRPSSQQIIPPDQTLDSPAQVQEKPRDTAPEPAILPDSRPIIAQRVAPPVRPAQPISDAASGSSGVGSVVVESRPAAPQSRGAASRSAADDVLFARKGPVLSVETVGSRTIAVGRESTYQVNLRNSGEVAADDLVLHVTLPEWTEVLGVNVTAGEAQMPETNRGGVISWRVGHVDAKSQQRLTVRLVPRQNRPFDLGVRWEFKPIATQAMIEVQEPKLSLKIEGPREVQYGKKEIYRLKLSNTGNGNAENVVLVLTPVGAGDNVPASHKVGLLPAGEEKTLDVELTARQAGTLTIQAEAHADNNVRTDLEEKVLVHRAALKLDVDGPKVQYVGSVANYVVRVRNTGSAPAKNIHFTILLPNGAKYLSGVDGIRRSASQNKLEWLLETLGPDVEQNFTLRCAFGSPGLGKARVYTTADDDLAASAETVVQIDSVANLTMEVKDPTGPVPVGEESVYELRVRNRGTREAENVEVFAYFSRGIEPVGAEGAPSRMGPGQVVFQPLPLLAPGAEAVLKVRARAEAAGNHVFRAEARCKQLNARLVSEATNLYYTDGPMESQGPQTAANPPAVQTPATNDVMRVVPHSASGGLMPAPARK